MAVSNHQGQPLQNVKKMRKIFIFFDKYLPKNIFIQILILFTFVTVISISMNFLLEHVFDSSIEKIKDRNRKQNIFILFWGMVFFAPLLETLIFQWIPTYLYSSFKKNSKYDVVFLVLTALIFGLVHSANIIYVVSAFIVGVCYITISLYYSEKKKNYFIPVAVIHFLNNLMVFMYYLFE